MRVFGVSVSLIIMLAVAFVVGAKFGGGIVSKLPVVGS